MGLVFYAVCFLIFSFCIFLLFQIKELRAKNSSLELELSNYKKNPTYDCQRLLANLASGSALLKIEAIDPADLFIWRPGRTR